MSAQHPPTVPGTPADLARRGYVVFYDGGCELCRRSVRWLQRRRADAPMQFIDVNDRSALARWPRIDPQAAQSEVFVIDPHDRLWGGYEAVVVLLAATLPGVRPALPLLRAEPLRWAGQKGYRWVSSNRHWLSQKLFKEQTRPV